MTAAKIRRQLQELRDKLKPSELLIVTLPPDSTEQPVDHYRAGMALRGSFQSIAIAADHDTACEIIRHLHDLGDNAMANCVVFTENRPAPDLPRIEPRPGQTARECAREYLQ